MPPKMGVVAGQPQEEDRCPGQGGVDEEDVEKLSIHAAPFEPDVIDRVEGNGDDGDDVRTPVQRCLGGEGQGRYKAGLTVGPKTRMVLESLDCVPFTPSQGICTPSPTNMATAMLVHGCGFHPVVMHSPRPGGMGYGIENVAPSPKGMAQGVYGNHMNHMFGGGVMMERKSPDTPLARSQSSGSSSSPGGGFVGSPSMGAPESQGRRAFDRCLVQEKKYYNGAAPNDGRHVGGEDDEEKLEVNRESVLGRMQSKILSKIDQAEALDIAMHFCSMEGIEINDPEDIPAEVVQLGALVISHGIPLELATCPADQFGSPVKGKKKGMHGAVNVQVDGVRLNARQRRSLRRAQARAYHALERLREDSTVVHYHDAPPVINTVYSQPFYYHHVQQVAYSGPYSNTGMMMHNPQPVLMSQSPAPLQPHQSRYSVSDGRVYLKYDPIHPAQTHQQSMGAGCMASQPVPKRLTRFAPGQ